MLIHVTVSVTMWAWKQASWKDYEYLEIQQSVRGHTWTEIW